MKYLTVPIIMILTSCSLINDPYKDYIGYWEVHSKYKGITEPTNDVLEIRKTNKNEYIGLVNNAMLKKDDGLNDKELMELLSSPIRKEQIFKIIEIPGERLAIEGKSKSTPLIFDKTTNEIYSNEIESETTILKKINEKEAKEIMRKRVLCNRLQQKKIAEEEEKDAETYYLSIDEISPEKKKRVDEIEKKYKELSKEIERCIIR